MIKIDYDHLEKFILGYNSKFKDGLTSSEIDHIVEKFEVNPLVFNEKFGIHTGVKRDNEFLFYHSDVLKTLNNILCTKE